MRTLPEVIERLQQDYFSYASKSQFVEERGRSFLVGYFPLAQSRAAKFIATIFPAPASNCYIGGYNFLWGRGQVLKTLRFLANITACIAEDEAKGFFPNTQTALVRNRDRYVDLEGFALGFSLGLRAVSSDEPAFQKVFQKFLQEHRLRTKR